MTLDENRRPRIRVLGVCSRQCSGLFFLPCFVGWKSGAANPHCAQPKGHPIVAQTALKLEIRGRVLVFVSAKEKREVLGSFPRALTTVLSKYLSMCMHMCVKMEQCV